MNFFKKKDILDTLTSENSMASPPVNFERPKICCIDLSEESFGILKSTGYNLYEGSLGATMKVPNKSRSDYSLILLDHNFPVNLHEYDILILDLTNVITKEYKSQDHEFFDTKRKNVVQLICSYPTTIFDPRPYTSTLLGQRVREIRNRKFLEIVFACESFEFEYEKIQFSNDFPERLPNERHNVYNFLHTVNVSSQRHGEEVVICDIREDLFSLLNKYKNDIKYEQTFSPVSRWSGAGTVDDPNFVPLIKNINGEIVSFSYVDDNVVTFVFPDIYDKGNFLNELFKNIFPAILPELFPFSTKFKWKESEEYFLPNHLTLLKEKVVLEEDFKKKNSEIDEKIKNNIDKYQFLHDLVTETGDKLVSAVYKFLKWLEFKTVIIKDEESKTILEEDIQVENENGILIIETKGIGGTSTDSDCSQISKIKLRRCKERKAFDVWALYIVNHQRYLPPIKRKNPPFTEHQINDAFNDERGLLTTWQMFKLYFDIQHDLIRKEDAREELLKYGLVEFKPKTKFKLPIPKNILKDGFVIIIDLENFDLRIGQTLIAEKNGNYFKVNIASIQLNDKPVNQVSNGEVGLKFHQKISNGTALWTQ